MLRCEMVRHAGVINDRQSNQAFLARPGQRRVARQKYCKARRRYCEREHDEANRLCAKERSVRFRAVCKVSARQSVTDPKEGGQTEVKQIERTRLRISIAVDEQKNDRREPERAEHPEPIPNRSTDPRRRQFLHPWRWRTDLNYGSG